MLLSEYKKDLSELIAVAGLLLDDPLNERWSPARVAEALNDACLDYALETQNVKETINIQLYKDTYEYDVKKQVEEDLALRSFGYAIRLGYNGSQSPGMWPTSLEAIDMTGAKQTTHTALPGWHMDSVSPGKVVLFGPPAADGDPSPAETGNMQVTYVAIPTYMDADGDYPDSHIPVIAYDILPFKAAARLLDEGDESDLIKSIEYEALYRKGVRDMVAESYRAHTVYDDARPV